MRGSGGGRDPRARFFPGRWCDLVLQREDFFLALLGFGSTSVEGESDSLHGRILRWSGDGVSPRQVLVTAPCQSHQFMQWGGKWLHPGAPGLLVMVWVGNHAGCEPAGMGVMGSGGQQSRGNNWFGGSGVEDELWGGFTPDV